MAPSFPSVFNKPAQYIANDVNKAVDDAGRTLLHVSVAKGDAETVERLLKLGADPRQTDVNGQSPLYAAVAAKNTALVDLLVQYGATFRNEDTAGFSPLAWAIDQNADVAFVEHLRAQGAELDFQGESGRAALMAAADANNIPALTWLLENNVPLDGVDAAGSTALHHAAGKGAHEVMKLLLDHGADPLVRNAQIKTALHIAAERGDEEAADMLLAFPEVRRTLNDFRTFTNGYTPLMAAIANSGTAERNTGHLAIAQKLIETGALINDVDFQNRHSLYIAVENSTPAMVKMLISHGADVMKAPLSGDRKQPMTQRISTNGYTEKLQLLADAGADLNAADSSGNTALHIAVETMDSLKARALLDAGAKAEIANADGRRPLDRAVELITYSSESRGIVAALLAAGASPNMARNENVKFAPLHVAARSGQSDIIKLLLKYGALVDVRDRQNGETPWLSAVSNGNGVVADILRLNGADVTVADKFGRNVLYHAAKSGASDILVAALKSPEFKDKVNTPDSMGNLPLNAAVNSYGAECVRIMLQAGANPLLVDAQGWTSLHYAARTSNERIFDLLNAQLGKTANWNLPTANSDKQTPLHLAARDGYSQAIDKLLKLGADVTIKDAHGQTPLIAAITSERSTSIRSLIEGMKQRKISVDGPTDNKGFAPLHVALQANYITQMTIIGLLDAGANVNLRAPGGDTALHMAVAKGRTDIIQLLLSRGADPTLVNTANASALDVARTLNRPDIVVQLQTAQKEWAKKAPPPTPAPAPPRPPVSGP
jgi:ankyrin repeat protein